MTPEEYEQQLVADASTDVEPGDWDDHLAEQMLAGFDVLHREWTNLGEVWQARIDSMMRARDEALEPMRQQLVDRREQIEAWAIAQRRASGRKSVKLPSGHVKTREGRLVIEVTDEAAVPESYIREKVVRSVDKQAIGKELASGDGPPVPGVTVTRQPTSVTIDHRPVDPDEGGS